MFDYLTDHALRNVWCTPDQDNQFIVKPARITPPNGTINTVRVTRRVLNLPQTAQRFHVFQIGQLHPLLLNLFQAQEQWITLAHACNTAANIVDIYNTQGVQYPRTQVWYIVTKERNVLIAVKRQPKLGIDFDATDLYLRVYNNQYFASERSEPLNDYVEVQGKTCQTSEDISQLQAFFNAKAQLPGLVYAFVNGRKVPAINSGQAKIGDVVEAVYDSSVIRVVDYPLATLPTFDSELDGKGKYLLHHNLDVNVIDYYDDIDVFLVNTVTGKGIYFHKNAVDAMRMVTHRDYAIPVAYVSAYHHHFLDSNGALDTTNLAIRLHIRKSGWDRPLVYEHHRIHEMYQLDHPDILDVMLGVDSVVPVWRAPALEKSFYTQLMRVNGNVINQDLVQKAYGYNATTVLVADTPKPRDMENPTHDVPVPYLLMFDCTVYEYDADGLLLDWHRHTQGAGYLVKNQACRYLEMIAGQGTHLIDDVYDQEVVTLKRFIGYRYYLGEDLGEGQWRWSDVTDTGQYVAGDFSATWLNTGGEKRLVRSDKTFLAYRKEVIVDRGVLGFHLTQKRIVGNLHVEEGIRVPLGELDLWLNGHPVIEGLDYHVKDGYVLFCTRKYLVNPTSQAQRIDVRYTGFCDSNLERTRANEFGFIVHGKISVNARYNLHEGKVQRIVCGGRMHVREEMKFSERSLSYEFDDADNGKPYLVRDYLIPLRDVVNRESYGYRQESVVVDKMVEDYLTLKRPEPPITEVNPIPERYALYSPFLCKIIFDLFHDTITTAQVYDHLSDEQVKALVAPYLYLFEQDPLHDGYPLERQYVVIYPHFLDGYVELNMPKVRFIRRVAALYGNDRVTLSSFIRMV